MVQIIVIIVFVILVKDAIIVITVSKDQAFLDDFLPKLQSFWEQHVVPEVLTRALENATPKEVTADAESIY